MNASRTVSLLSVAAACLGLSAAPAPAAEYRFTPKPSVVEGIGSPILSLDGEWRFHPAPPGDFYLPGKAGSPEWKPIRVPGDWTMQGFAVKPWTPAGYVKSVEIPKTWAGKRILLRFDSVQSDARVWVNGSPAGSHLGGFNAFELDVTALCRAGAPNTIALAVQNESVADQLASATQYAAYQIGGITRKAYLLAVPQVRIAALRIVTDFDGDFRDARLKVRISLRNDGPGPARNVAVALSLADPAGNPVALAPDTLAFADLAPGAVQEKTFESGVTSPRKWDAEHPSIYALSLALSSEGRPREIVNRRLGFRKVEVLGTRVFVNGTPIKIRGVNRHETHPLLGRSLTPELWRRDAELFRAANVNLVRTSHYPPAEEFLDLCDALGLFVECEAPLVWINHGANELWKKENPDDPKFYPVIERAIGEMIALDADHPSILFWSLANESGWGPSWVKAKAFAEALDPTRPKTFHDQSLGSYNNLGSEDLPIANYHYPPPNGPELAVGFGRPLLYGEYAHVNTYNRAEIAADPGVRDEYGRGFERMWELIDGSPVVLGGNIWAGINDVFFLPSGKAVGYGEWGLLDGWRREKPEYWHVKKSYSPVRVHPLALPVPGPGEPLLLEVENRHDFTNLKELLIGWRIGAEYGTVVLDLPPRRTGVLAIRPKSADLAGKTLRLEFSSWRGFNIDAFEIPLGGRARAEAPFRSLSGGALELKDDGARIVVTGGSFRWTLDRKTGAIISAEAGDVPVVSGGPALMILPQTTGPCVTDYSLDIPPLNDVCPGWTAEKVEAAKEGSAAVVTVQGRVNGAAGRYRIRFEADGRTAFEYEFAVTEAVDPRQWGLVLYLPREYDTLSWSRRGQWPGYPDSHIGRPEGTAKALGAGRDFKFRERPGWDWKDDQNALGSNDFRSTKSRLNWAALASGKGLGLLLSSDGRQAARSFLDGNRVGWLIADFNTGGGDLFFAPHHRLDDRPLKKGDAVKGAFTVRLVRSLPGESR